MPTPDEQAAGWPAATSASATPAAVAAPASTTDLVAQCLAAAQQKDAAGDTRGAFLACQALLIDQYENISPRALASLYAYMARLSEAQGLDERAAKYRKKSAMLRRQAENAAGPEAAQPRPVSPAEASWPPLPQEPTLEQQQEPAELPALARVSTPPEPTEGEPAPEPAEPRPSAFSQPPAKPAAQPPAAGPVRPEPAGTAGEGAVLVAGFWIRLVAGAIDLLLVVAITLAALAVSSLLLSGGFWVALSFFAGKLSLLCLLAGILCVFLLAYQAVFTVYGGQTAGKMLLGLKVVGPDGHSPGWRLALLRLLGMVLALLPGLAGLLWIAFDRERRGWHDRLAQTLVVDLRAMQRAVTGDAGAAQ